MIRNGHLFKVNPSISKRLMRKASYLEIKEIRSSSLEQVSLYSKVTYALGM